MRRLSTAATVSPRPGVAASPAEGANAFRLLPRAYYVSPEIFAKEMEQVFCKQWVFPGHASTLPVDPTGSDGIKDGTAVAFLGMTWDLRRPIKIGDTIRVHQSVAAKRGTKKPDQGLVTFDVAVVNQNGEVTQEGQWKILMLRRAGQID